MRCCAHATLHVSQKSPVPTWPPALLCLGSGGATVQRCNRLRCNRTSKTKGNQQPAHPSFATHLSTHSSPTVPPAGCCNVVGCCVASRGRITHDMNKGKVVMQYATHNKSRTANTTTGSLAERATESLHGPQHCCSALRAAPKDGHCHVSICVVYTT